VLFRILQGVAGALLVPGSIALLTVTFSGEARGRAFGLWAAASAGTTILGPFVGGILVDSVSWRAVFLLNVPLLIVALWATQTYVQESRAEGAHGRFDWASARSRPSRSRSSCSGARTRSSRPSCSARVTSR
jgi:MFS family permease